MAGKKRKAKRSRDIEKAYPVRQFAAKLKRLAQAVTKGKSFAIQIHGERVHIPADAVINIEHERSGKAEEVEFQLKWKRR